ncbi:hypothetical protein BO221_33345 [Archangium sp. Cb G35]|nr:hypothetical protein BO221_33345 [Archangium sp. Cb G35]
MAAACAPSEESQPETPRFAQLGRAIDETCTRNAALLLSLQTAPRVCNNDEECPWGSYCSLSTKVCAWECLEGGTGATACASGKVCGCDGRCGTTGAPVSTATQQAVLATEPMFLAFTSPATAGGVWTSKSLDVSLTVNTPAETTEAAKVALRVVGGQQLEVSCDASGTGTFGAECVLGAPWTFNAVGSQQRSTRRVWVRPAAGSTQQAWEVLLEGAGATPRRLRVSSALAASSGTSGSPILEFQGHVSLDVGVSTSSYTAGNGTRASVVRLPVRAWADSTSLLLYDESRTLSPTGTLRLSNSPTAYTEFSWLPSKTAAANAETTDAMTAFVTNSTFTGLPSSGGASLSGRFSVITPVGGLNSGIPMYGRYLLSVVKGATVATCGATQSCASGYVCEPGPQVCVPGNKAWTPLSQGTYSYYGTNARNTIVHEQRKAWEESGSLMLTQGLGTFNRTNLELAQGLLCNSGNGSDPTVLFGTAVLHNSGDLACANGAPPFTANLFTQKDRQALSSTPVLNSAQMLQACLADVKKLPLAGMPNEVRPWFTERLKNPGQCLSAARLFDTLTLIGRNPTMREDRLPWYLLQQWVGTHGFLARQSLLQAEAVDFLGTQPQSVSVPQMATVLDQLESGWDLLLDGSHDFFYSYANRSNMCGLRNPDYRLPVRPLGTWWNMGDGLEPTRDSLLYSGDMTMFWYGNWTQQNACSEYEAEVMCPQAPDESCGGRCRTGFYNILSYGEADDGDYEAKFFIHKSTYDYLGGPGEYLVAEHYDYTTGQRSYARWWLEFMDDRPSTLPLVVRRKNGQYHMYDRQLKGKVCSPPESCYPLQPSHDSTNWGETIPYDGETFRLDDPSTEPSHGLAIWDHALSEAELEQMTTRSLGEFLESSADLQPPTSNLPHHEQGMGLPTAMLESLTAHLELLNAELARVGRTTYKTCKTYNAERAQAIERFGRTMRYSMALEQRASYAASRQQGCARNQGLPWEARFKRARTELDAVRTRTLEQFRLLEECEPMGIPDDEAPLYFASANGASERFFASSDYIFSHAEQAVATASSTLDSARTAWDQARTSAIQEQLSSEDADRRMEQLKAQYGRPLVEMCGLEIDAKDALAAFDPSNSAALKPESCYIAKAQDPSSCSINPSELYAAVTREDARYTLCVWNGIKAHSAASLGSPFSEVAANWATAEISGGNVTAGGKSFEVRYLYQSPISTTRDVPGAKLAEVQQSCSQALGGIYSLPAPTDVGRKMSAACYRGEMGTAALSIVAAHQSLLVARSAWGDAQERYEVANRQCVDLETRNEDAKRNLLQTHENHMKELRDKKAALDQAVNAVGGVERVLQTAQTGAMIGASAGGPYGAIAGAAVGALVGLFNVGAGAGSIELQRQIEEAERAFQIALVELEMDESVTKCFEASRVHMIGIKTAALQADRAMTDVDLALLNLQNMESRIRQLLAEGNVAVEREAARTVPSIAHHYWLDERIAKAKSSFDWARRLAYVLALSLEHERQQSLTAREDIAVASNVSQLNTAFDKLRPAQFVRKVNGKVPGEASVTLSMAADVLKLSNLSSTVDGERSLSKGERFARRLLSAENAVFDKNGRYVGQGLRFSMPQPVGLAYRCAERLWSVRANVVAGGLENWTLSNGAQLLLYKRNTFQSHWCDGLGDGSAYQSRVYRPSLDVTGEKVVHLEGETSSYSTASLLSTINVPRDTWQTYECSTQYGCTSELAGRGFYGEYLLVFPYQGLIAAGFDLGTVEDVLMRMEVVSVDNSPPVQLSPAREQVGTAL